MRAYEISNPASGVVLGVYSGAGPREAYRALCRDAGYPSMAAAYRVTGAGMDELDFVEVAQ